MRSLPRPSDRDGVEFVPADVFDTCIQNFENGIRESLEGIRDEIVNAALSYDALASEKRLHDFPNRTNVGGVSGDVLKRVYTEKLAKKGHLARRVYDRILIAAENVRCPLCSIESAKTLDHHLPQSRYADVVVTPINLVPACTTCQSEKKQKYPQSAGEQTLHPYFDAYDVERWLTARVDEDTAGVFKYDIRRPETWSDLDEERVRWHLKTLNLPMRFSEYAATEMVEVVQPFLMNRADSSLENVRRYFLDKVEEHSYGPVNSVRRAMYEAAAHSDWFCGGGYRMVGG